MRASSPSPRASRRATTRDHARARSRLGAALLAALLAAGCAPTGDGDHGSARAVHSHADVATVDAARQMLDLSVHPLAVGAEAPAQRTASWLEYRAPGEVAEAFGMQARQLREAGWREGEATFVNAQSGSAVFTRSGFALSLGVRPAGAGSVAISLRHHGNIAFDRLPRPGDWRPLHVTDHAAVYVSDAAPEAAMTAFAERMQEAGWEPYGSAGPTQYFRRHAVRLSATAAAAPAQGGRTTVSLAGELLSAQIPAPPGASTLSFVDARQELLASVAGPLERVIADYADVLAPLGWSPSLQAPVRIDGRQVMTFRNAAQDMMRLSFADTARGANLTIGYQSKAQIDAMNQRLDEQAEDFLRRQQG